MSARLLVVLGVLLGCQETTIAPYRFRDAGPGGQFDGGFGTDPFGLVRVTGTVVDGTGAPLAGALVTLEGREAKTGVDGRFDFPALPRRNALLEVSLAGHHIELVPAFLMQPADVVDIPAVPLYRKGARMLFAGDTSWGRRFMEPLTPAPRGVMPVDTEDAFVQVSDPAPGAIEVVSRVAPLFWSVDYPILNLESPVLHDPATPHMQKSFAYFTLPGALKALHYLGVPYVSLGNNHIYDYLSRGLEDTLAALDAEGIAYSGAGLDFESAFAPHRVELGGASFSLISANAIAGESHDIMYNASETQGGAAGLGNRSHLRRLMAAEIEAGHVPIAQWHDGWEYVVEPTPKTRTRLDFGAESGAALVIAHHPHVAQGFGIHQGVLQAFCLGNFAFDQDRLETLLGLVVLADFDGAHNERLIGVPIYLEDYRPRFATGDLAAVLLRRLAELSDPEGLSVIPHGDRIHVFREAAPPPVEVEDALEITLPESGELVVDLRGRQPAAASLARIEPIGVAPSRVDLGRDILLHGTFEDEDLDELRGEQRRWDTSTDSKEICRRPRRGLFAACSYRHGGAQTDSVIAFRNRIRLWGSALNTPNRDVTLVGHIRGENAGPITIVARYFATAGPAEFGEEVAFEHPGGDFEFTPFAAPLTFPPERGVGDPDADEPRAVRFFLRHGGPAEGDGVAVYDDFAVVTWDHTLRGTTLRTPHARDFLRIRGRPGARHRFRLVFSTPRLFP